MWLCAQVASKFEEIYPCDMDDLLYICERSYSREELIECVALVRDLSWARVSNPLCVGPLQM